MKWLSGEWLIVATRAGLALTVAVSGLLLASLDTVAKQLGIMLE